jgi:hypothetical protein
MTNAYPNQRTNLPKLPIKFPHLTLSLLRGSPTATAECIGDPSQVPLHLPSSDQRLAVTLLLLRRDSHDCAETHIFVALGALILPVLCRCCGDDSRWPGLTRWCS